MTDATQGAADQAALSSAVSPNENEYKTPQPLTCVDCPSIEHTSCIECRRVYCRHYASTIDDNFCKYCLWEGSAAVHVHPLKDVEGIAHAGRWILPEGSIYKTLPRAIADMSEVELDDYLKYIKAEVKATETKVQYLRIADSTAQMEKDHRQILDARRLRGIKLPASVGTGIKVDGAAKKQSPEEKLKDVAATIKAMGITKEMLEALLRAKGGVK